MLPSTLRFAVRRLARRPGTTALHVGGLAVGLACCFLAALFVRDELRYDRFHDGADRIVEVRQRMRFGDAEVSMRGAPAGASDVLRAGTAGVEAVAPTTSETALIRRTGRSEGVRVEELRFADPSFFDVFTFPLVRGDARTALDGPNRAVLTASLARSLFGDADPVGRTVLVERTGHGPQDPEPSEVTVTGIAVDPPAASTFRFELLVSGRTLVATFEGPEPALGETPPTYVRVGALRDTAAVQAALNRLAADTTMVSAVEVVGIRTPRFVDEHLSEAGGTSGMTGRPLTLVLFSTVAALVLVLACVNYANLATALALGRATEVGVRKAVGAGRGHLARQFLSESVLLAVAASVVALGLVALVLPAFNAFFDKGVALSALGPPDALAALGLVLSTGLLAGAYPAAVLVRFRPASVLKGAAVQGRGGTRVRQALVVFQFAVTAVLLASTAVVAAQLDAARTRDLGFEGDRVVVLDLQGARLSGLRSVLQREVEALPGVARTSLASSVPGVFNMMMPLSPPGTTSDPSDDVTTAYVNADAGYPETLGLRMAAGEWFRPDAASGVIVNETAARQLGLMTTDPAAAVGRSVGFSGGTEVEVLGIVRDFHFDGLRSEIRPVVVTPMSEFSNQTLLAVQLRSADARTVGALRATWERLAPEYPFAPRFVSDTFAERLRQDRQLGQLFGAFGLVAVVLACLGVFGLAAHTAERRTKEVGVRKVLGASVAGLVALLSAEFVRLVLVALVVAAPVTALLARRWLEEFAYPAPLQAGPFVAIGLGVLALALLTVSVHAVRAAMADPVKALRSE